MARRPNQADYDVLGADRDAPLSVARAAYHRRARILHPDSHPDATAEERDRLVAAMAALNAAWEAIEGAGDAGTSDTGAAAGAEPWRSRQPPPGFEFQRPAYGSTAVSLRLVDGAASLDGLGPWVDGLGALVLHGRAVTDADLRRLPRLPRLHRLDLSGTRITDAAIPTVVARAPALHELDLSATAVTAAGLSGLEAAPELQELTLVDTALTDVALAALAGLRRLDTLNLRGSGVRGEGLHELARLPNLRLLALPRVARADRRRFEQLRPDVHVL